MRITDMQVTPIAVTDPPLLNAVGLHAPWALRAVVELVSDERIGGVSEVPGDLDTVEALRAARETVVDRDPYHLNSLIALLRERLGTRGVAERGGDPWDRRTFVHVAAAVEVACFDLIGRSIGRPVCDLLGGPVRDRVPFAGYLFYKHRGAGGALGFDVDPAARGWAAARQAEALSPDAIVDQARAMVEAFGFRALKLKAGAVDPAIDVAAILRLRDTFGAGVPLRIDPNGVWSVETAIRCGEQMKGVLEYFEDPVRGQADMATVGRRLGIPMATNMFTTSFEDIPGSIALGAEDVILGDHHYWGGFRPSLDLAAVCRTFGRGLSMHSNSHLGISLMAMTHLAAVVPNLTYSLDTHYPWQSEEVISGGRIAFDGGALPVPATPGLGVELDRVQLAALHEQYLRCGQTIRDDAAEMRKIKPGWEYKPTRW
jgi:glucarate dehydratase